MIQTKDKNKKFVLYVHISPNGKKYYGITSMKTSKRWGRGTGYKKQPYFYHAIQKYGWDNFEHVILFGNLTKEEACQKEIEYIAKDKTNDVRYGYNMSSGGEVNDMSDIGKQKLSNDRKGVRYPERMIALNDDWTENIDSYSDEVDSYIKPKHSHCSNNNSVKLICDNIVYTSMSEFADCHGMKVSRIVGWFSGKNPVPKCYVDENLHILEDNYRYEERYNKSNRMMEIDGIIFESVSSCAKAIGVTRHTIARWLNGKMQIPPDIQKRGLKYIDKPNYYYIKVKGDF